MNISSRRFSLALFCLGLAAPAFAASAPTYKLLKEIPVGGDGGWDYLSIDPAAHRLYVSHGSVVIVIDTATNTVVGKIEDTPGVHGLAVCGSTGEGHTLSTEETRRIVGWNVAATLTSDILPLRALDMAAWDAGGRLGSTLGDRRRADGRIPTRARRRGTRVDDPGERRGPRPPRRAHERGRARAVDDPHGQAAGRGVAPRGDAIGQVEKDQQKVLTLSLSPSNLTVDEILEALRPVIEQAKMRSTRRR